MDPVPGCKSGRTVVYLKGPTTGLMRMHSHGPRAPAASDPRAVFDIVTDFEAGAYTRPLHSST